MARGKSTVKDHWYVLVFTEAGPKYVTKVDNARREAYWNIDDVPHEMTKENAQYMAMALSWNGHTAIPVCARWEIDTHPYRYHNYHIEWVENEEVAKDDKS